jgi:hypothetical protein
VAPPHPNAASLASTGTTTFLVVAALLVVAVLMVAMAVWLIRATRRDPPALAPLERMGDRSWRKAGAEARAASLAAARPPGAVPPAPMIEFEPVAESAAEPDPEPAPEPVAESADDLGAVEDLADAAGDEKAAEEGKDAETAGVTEPDDADEEAHPPAGVEDEADGVAGRGYARSDG